MAPSQTATRSLTREAIADAALGLLAREGPRALTMRGLAAELEVGTMTLYGHFRTKDELLAAALDRAGDEVVIPQARGPWRPRLEALMLEIYRTLRRYPVAVELRASAPMQSPGVLRSTQAGLELLAQAGLGKTDRARSWRLLFTYVFGYVAFTPAELSPESRRALSASLAALPEDALPRIADSVPEAVEAMAGEETFRAGLAMILDGIEARAASSAT